MSKYDQSSSRKARSSNCTLKPGLIVKGAMTLRGQKFVQVTEAQKKAYIPYHEFIPGGSPAKYLIAQDCILVGSRYRELVSKVESITAFKKTPLLENPGWSEGYFSLPNGTVLSPPDRKQGIAIFAPDRSKCAAKGAGRDWRDEVAGLVADQVLPAFLMMAVFSPPILGLTNRSDNPAFEIAGAKGTGKTTLLRLISTAVGPGVDDGRGVYWQSLNSTLVGLETSMQRHSDMPFILDEASHFAAHENRKARASAMVTLAFQLASGHPKSRFGDVQPTQHRFTSFISTNEPLTQLMAGTNTEREFAALDRLLTIPVLDGPYGIFDSVPAPYQSGSEFSAAIEKACRKNYGLAFPRFVDLLVKMRAEDEAGLRKKIRRMLKEFRRRVGVDENNGSAVRVCDAFGFGYAAGKLAVSFRILPTSYNCMEIAAEAYSRHLACRDERSPSQRALDLSRSARVLDVSKVKKSKLTLADIEKHDGVLHRRGRTRELLLTHAQFRRLFPLSRSTIAGSDLEWLLTRDRDHQTVKRKLGHLEPIRFFCVDLNGLSDG